MRMNRTARTRRVVATTGVSGRQRKAQLERICNDLGYYLEAIKRKLRTADEYALELDGLSARDIDAVDDILDDLESIDTTALEVILEDFL